MELFRKYERVPKIATLYEYQLPAAFRSDVIRNCVRAQTLANLEPNLASRLARQTNQWYIPRPGKKFHFPLNTISFTQRVKRVQINPQSLTSPITERYTLKPLYDKHGYNKISVVTK